MKRDNIKGFNQVVQGLKNLKENQKRQKKITAAITFMAPHAKRVHEDLEMMHPNGGQAKFLEQPLRMYGKEVTKKVKELVRQGMQFRAAIIAAAQWFLDNKVKPLVPVDTSELKNSGVVNVANN